MSLESGTRIGSYDVIALLGAGGMGEVYRARDTRLHRDVALKILPAAFASDPERMARFEREAQLLASLNHPNIAQIYGLERAGRTSALVMELVEGETLAERIRRPDHLRQGYGGPPKLDAKAEGLRLPELGRPPEPDRGRPSGLPIDDAGSHGFLRRSSFSFSQPSSRRLISFSNPRSVGL